MAGMFDDLIPQQPAAPVAGGGMFDDLIPKKTGGGDPNFIIPAPGGMDAAFQQFDQQPARPEADVTRMEDLASAYRQAPAGRGMAVDQRVRQLKETTNPYLNATFQGLTSGFGDEAGAGIRTGLGQGDSYGENLAVERELLRRQRQDAPWTMAGAEIAGAAIPAAMSGGASILARGAGAAPGWLARVGDAAINGGLWGGLYGFGTGEGLQGRAENAVSGATIGAALGGGLGAVLPGAATPKSASPVVQAADRVGVAVPTAVATDNMAAQRLGQTIRNVPVVGDAIPRAMGEAVDQLGGAVRTTADDLGGSSGPNAAHQIGQTIGGAAEAETAAATRAAQQADAAALQAFEAKRTGALNQVGQVEQGDLQRAGQAVGDVSPQDMGAALVSRLKAGESAARAEKERLYGIASQPGSASVQAGAVREVHGRVAQALEDAGRPIDTILTPASSRMMAELDNLASLKIQNKAVGARPAAGAADEAPVTTAVDLNGIELVRKRLNGLSRAASNDADRSAGRMIVREFDNWLGDAFDNALFTGSDDALKAFKDARAANADWRTRFGFNGRDDADKVINKVVTGEVTPQEMSNWLVGASKVGAQGLSSRLLTRVAEATKGDPQALDAIRGGVWNRLSQTAQGVDDKAAPRVANDIFEFVNGSGRDVARRLYTPEQQKIMTAYAETLRDGVTARAGIEAAAKANKPVPTEVGIGPLQELANTVLGRSGRSDEALYSAISAYAKSGSRGDIQTLGKILRTVPQDQRSGLAGAMVRDLGVSPRSGQWSPDVFLSQWRSYTPQAKTLLFGNAGKHRADLDDIALIAQRFQDVGRRFGNPSGTAQNTAGLGFLTAFAANPVAAISTALGGMVASRILAAPATANSMARWARTYQALVKSPTRAALGGAQVASRRFASDIGRELGLTQYTQQINQALQNAVADATTDDGVEPPRPR